MGTRARRGAGGYGRRWAPGLRAQDFTVGSADPELFCPRTGATVVCHRKRITNQHNPKPNPDQKPLLLLTATSSNGS